MKRIAFAFLTTLATAGVTAAQADIQFTDIAHMSCGEAWTAAGDSEETFVEYVMVLANHSVEARKIAFPDTKEAGDELGDRIVAGCVWDPDSNMYGVVDRAVRRVVD